MDLSLATQIESYALNRHRIEARHVARGIIAYYICVTWDNDWTADVLLPDEYGDSDAEVREAMIAGAARLIGEQMAGAIEDEKKPQLTLIQGGG